MRRLASVVLLVGCMNNGPSGAEGPAGAMGASGASGAMGDPGASGAMGVSGTSGPSGPTGPSLTATPSPVPDTLVSRDDNADFSTHGLSLTGNLALAASTIITKRGTPFVWDNN